MDQMEAVFSKTVNIQGRMLYVEKNYDKHFIVNPGFSEEDIKMDIAQLLVDELFKSGYIEFTKEDDPYTNATKVRGRIFVTPKADVMVLRKMGY
jgi:hypothetical protein